MTVNQLIEYLRKSVSIQDPSGTTEQDKAYLSMTDEEILLFMNMSLTMFVDVPSLDYLPTEKTYPLILLVKKELYHTLAVKDAPLFDVGADNNNYLKRDQRFKHYMMLIEEVDKEYNKYNEDGGAGGNTLTSYDVLLSNRYATQRNYDKGTIPALILYLDYVGTQSAEISWKVGVGHFFSCTVYVSLEPILDMYNITEHISSKAIKVASIKDVHQTKCRIEGLIPETKYYILVSVKDISSLTGYKEISLTTLAPILEV